MSTRGQSRRSFLKHSVSGLSAAWLAANYTAIMEAEAFVQQTAPGGAPYKFQFFTPEQASEVEAMAAQIIPTDETPGAKEARVINFIDRALVTFERDRQPVYTQGLKDLQAKSAELVPGATKFSALTSEQQIKVLTSLEKSPFFTLVRTHTVTGFFAHPSNGGNYNKVGWKLVNYDDSLNHKPPFGYYDAIPPSQR